MKHPPCGDWGQALLRYDPERLKGSAIPVKPEQACASHDLTAVKQPLMPSRVVLSVTVKLGRSGLTSPPAGAG